MIVQALQDIAKAMSGLQVDGILGWVVFNLMRVMPTHGKSHAYGPPNHSHKLFSALLCTRCSPSHTAGNKDAINQYLQNICEKMTSIIAYNWKRKYLMLIMKVFI
mmetsp:Transcript_17725/g.35375  ORF Transcript_17725/g.35375 Transcript_17725/m.35375 type:complete len:105 (+) Transcript_17725:299-613(+)